MVDQVINNCQIIDLAVPYDTRMDSEENEKNWKIAGSGSGAKKVTKHYCGNNSCSN